MEHRRELSSDAGLDDEQYRVDAATMDRSLNPGIPAHAHNKSGDAGSAQHDGASTRVSGSELAALEKRLRAQESIIGQTDQRTTLVAHHPAGVEEMLDLHERLSEVPTPLWRRSHRASVAEVVFESRNLPMLAFPEYNFD